MNTTKLINVGRSRLAKAAKSAAVPFVSCALLIATMTAYSQVTVTMTTAPFDTAAVGYMSWTPNPADSAGYGGAGSSPWGVSALPAVFSGNTLTLSPNVNVWPSPVNSYWVNQAGNGANIMDAAVYVEVGGGQYANEQVTFWYYVDANTLSAPYTVDSFIKDFGPGFAFNGEANGTMTPGWNSVTYTLTGNNAGEIVQYGFEVIGPDANPATVAAYGNVQIGSPPTSPNLLVDPDFASGTPVANGIGGWTPFNGAAFSTDYTFGPTTYSMENSGGGGYSVPGSYQVLASTAGSAYLLTGYGYIPTALTGTSQAFLQATFYDSMGDNLGTVQTFPGPNGALASTPIINSASPTGTWIEMQEIFTAPADTASVAVYTLVLDADPTTAYFDELNLIQLASPPPPPPQPTSPAPTPSLPAADVLAMYDSSGVYTEVPVDDWIAGWSNAGETDFTIPSTSRVVLKYTGVEYAGVEFYSPDNIDVSSYNYMHFDVWTPGANQLAVQLVSLSPTLAGQVDITPLSGVITDGQWIGIDIPLSQFTAAANQLDPGTVDLTDLQQLLWVDNGTVGSGTQGGTFYIDNVYFYTRTVPPPFRCSITQVGSNVQISWPSTLGITYTVVESPALGSSADWTAVGSNVIGTGGTKMVSVPTPPTTMFFQVMQDY
jgi:hypothetical protein